MMTWKKLFRRTNLLIGMVITLIMIFIAVFAPLLSPYHPTDDADLGGLLSNPGTFFTKSFVGSRKNHQENTIKPHKPMKGTKYLLIIVLNNWVVLCK